MRKNPIRTLLLCLTITLVAGSSIAQFEIRHESPRFEGEKLPEPPMQGQPWDPPATSLPASFVAAAASLFDTGMADPRNCEYLEITVVVGSSRWGNSQKVTTHGWVFPGAGAGQDFAVCWSGLVYPVVSRGAAADLRKDVEELLSMESQRAIFRGGGNRAFPEQAAVSHTNLVLIKPCLLLRLGEARLAEQLWEFMTADIHWNDPQHAEDPYLILAQTWAWAIFDRALGAHMRSDDNLALAVVRDLVQIRETIEAEAKKRNYWRPSEARGIYLSFLEQVPEFAKDQERRATRRVREADQNDAEPESVAALIEKLEDVSVRQMSQPGMLVYADSPIVQALIAKGAEAVEALIQCVEEDDRLTRSVGFSRDFHMNRHIGRVDRVALVALDGIFQSSSFSTYSYRGGPEEVRAQRKKLGAALRSYWQNVGGLSAEDRWFAILADDQQRLGRWIEAAQRIVQFENIEMIPGAHVGSLTQGKPWPDGEQPGMRGEVLRGRSDPSVTDLLIRRIGEMAPRFPEEARDVLHGQCEMALYLAQWDGAKAVPILRELSEKCRRQLGRFDQDSWQVEILGRFLAQMTIHRVQSGDDSAIGEYVKWIRDADPRRLFSSSYFEDVLRPLWSLRDNAEVPEAVDWLFNHPDSPWLPLLDLTAPRTGYRFSTLFQTDLVNMAGFRKAALRLLDDQSEAGVAVVENGRGRIRQGTATRGFSIKQDDPLAPPPGVEMEIRVCDLVAWLLQSIPDAPELQPYWPQSRRDDAIAEWKRFLSDE